MINRLRHYMAGGRLQDRNTELNSGQPHIGTNRGEHSTDTPRLPNVRHLLKTPGNRPINGTSNATFPGLSSEQLFRHHIASVEEQKTREELTKRAEEAAIKTIKESEDQIRKETSDKVRSEEKEIIEQQVFKAAQENKVVDFSDRINDEKNAIDQIVQAYSYDNQMFIKNMDERLLIIDTIQTILPPDLNNDLMAYFYTEYARVCVVHKQYQLGGKYYTEANKALAKLPQTGNAPTQISENNTMIKFCTQSMHSLNNGHHIPSHVVNQNQYNGHYPIVYPNPNAFHNPTFYHPTNAFNGEYNTYSSSYLEPLNTSLLGASRIEGLKNEDMARKEKRMEREKNHLEFKADKIREFIISKWERQEEREIEALENEKNQILDFHMKYTERSAELPSRTTLQISNQQSAAQITSVEHSLQNQAAKI